MSIRIAELDSAIANVLAEYGESAQEAVENAAVQVAKETASELRVSSPKDRGEYASSWSSKVQRKGGKVGAVVYNKKHYRLTHLLEYGHLKRNSTEHTKAIPHIEPAEQTAIEEYERKIKEALQQV